MIASIVTARSRRVEYSEQTRAALVSSAVQLFTNKGYTGTSLDEIAQRARLTKGALYHHFGGKQELFEAALEAVEVKAQAKLSDIITGPGDPWDTVVAGLGAYIKT